jgi:hypothetical protein
MKKIDSPTNEYEDHDNELTGSPENPVSGEILVMEHEAISKDAAAK